MFTSTWLLTYEELTSSCFAGHHTSTNICNKLTLLELETQDTVRWMTMLRGMGTDDY